MKRRELHYYLRDGLKKHIYKKKEGLLAAFKIAF